MKELKNKYIICLDPTIHGNDFTAVYDLIINKWIYVGNRKFSEAIKELKKLTTETQKNI